MKYYIIAGEASGELHGSNLVKGLIQVDKNADIRAWGGDLMEIAGATIVKHYKETAFMGIFAVLANLRKISNNFKECKSDILSYQPDVLILIDYPGFNLRMAKFAKQNNLKVFYYISPKVWAWKENRVKSIKKYVDKLFVIFPFEKDFYKKHNYSVEFAGNPLVDAIENRTQKDQSFDDFIKHNNLNNKPIIALLPGSRKQEISQILPIMLEMIPEYPEYQFVIAGTKALDENVYKQLIKNKNVSIVYDNTYSIIQQAKVALVTSGTATLETALLLTPQIVCYKFKEGKLIYILGQKLLKIKFISLVNIIMDQEVVIELIQHHLTKINLKIELDNILFNETYNTKMLEKYNELKNKLGEAGASKRFAQLMYNYLHK